MNSIQSHSLIGYHKKNVEPQTRTKLMKELKNSMRVHNDLHSKVIDKLTRMLRPKFKNIQHKGGFKKHHNAQGNLRFHTHINQNLTEKDHHRY